MADFKTALGNEINEVERRIVALTKRRELLVRLLNDESGESEGNAAIAPAASPSVVRPPKQVGIAEAAKSLISKHGPTKTRDLVPAMEDLGLLTRGRTLERQVNVISMALSKDSRFNANRTSGWSLKE